MSPLHIRECNPWSVHIHFSKIKMFKIFDYKYFYLLNYVYLYLAVPSNQLPQNSVWWCRYKDFDTCTPRLTNPSQKGRVTMNKKIMDPYCKGVGTPRCQPWCNSSMVHRHKTYIFSTIVGQPARLTNQSVSLCYVQN